MQSPQQHSLQHWGWGKPVDLEDTQGWTPSTRDPRAPQPRRHRLHDNHHHLLVRIAGIVARSRVVVVPVDVVACERVLKTLPPLGSTCQHSAGQSGLSSGAVLLHPARRPTEPSPAENAVFPLISDCLLRINSFGLQPCGFPRGNIPLPQGQPLRTPNPALSGTVPPCRRGRLGFELGPGGFVQVFWLCPGEPEGSSRFPGSCEGSCPQTPLFKNLVSFLKTSQAFFF